MFEVVASLQRFSMFEVVASLQRFSMFEVVASLQRFSMFEVVASQMTVIWLPSLPRLLPLLYDCQLHVLRID
jgi:TolB-like protein